MPRCPGFLGRNETHSGSVRVFWNSPWHYFFPQKYGNKRLAIRRVSAKNEKTLII